MKIIYPPKGTALEYASLACNIYKGCTHGCTYCYGPACLRKSRQDYFGSPDPKEFALDGLREDAQHLAADGDCPEILLSFIGDPYQPYETEHVLTRQAIQILIEHNLPFTILTKGGKRAERDFDLLQGYHRARLGVSLSWIYQTDADQYEPHAAQVIDRISSLYSAKHLGIPTWVSLEPVIDPDQALILIDFHSHVVDHWMIGKINHNRTLENAVDWPAFVAEAKRILHRKGVKFTFKRSLMGA